MHTYHYGEGQQGNQESVYSLIINLLGLRVLGT